MKDEIHWAWKIFLFITRPTIWIYNRLIVLFITFYAFFGVFLGIGPICQSKCSINGIQMQQFGLRILLEPFINVLYLFEFGQIDFSLKSYNLINENAISKYEMFDQNTSDDLMLGVIKQTLLAAILIDLLISLWSVLRKFCKNVKAKNGDIAVDDRPATAKLNSHSQM